MDALRKKYDNFMAPSFRIKVEGADVAKECQVHITNLKVTTSLDAAGSLSFDVLNGYDLEGRCFKESVKSSFMIGLLITAEVGYAQGMLPVFQGYIYSVNMQFSDTPVYSVTCMDVIRLLQESDVAKKTYEMKSPAIIVKEIMDSYKGICPAKNVTIEGADIKENVITQSESDYSFITNILCPMAGNDFYVAGGKVMFVPVNKRQESVLTLEWGKDLLSFNFNRNYLHKSLRIVKANKEKSIEMLEGILVVKGDYQLEVLSKPLAKNIKHDAFGDQAGIDRQLKKAASDELRNSCRASGTCIGIPQIVPGKGITVKKLDEQIDGTYEIIKVDHSIGDDGFNTSFELGGKVE